MKNFNIKKRFLESSFLKVINIIRKNLNVYFYTIVLDFIFLALIVLVGKYSGSLIPSNPQQLMDLFKSSTNLLLFVFGYPILFYLFVLFVYSITKLSILNLVKSLYEKNRFTLKRLCKFYLLNILLFVIFFFGGLILLGILALIFKKEFLTYVVLVLLIPFLFLLYSIINISNTLFIKSWEKGAIKKSFSIGFSNINKYGMFVIWDFAVILAYLLFYNIIHLIFRLFIFSNEEILTNYGGIYLKVFNIISLVVIYLVIAFNRIYFYERIDKDVL